MSKARYSKTAPPPMSVGEWLRGLREKGGWTLKAVAPEVGMHFTLLQKIEAGERQPSEAQIKSLAAFYGADAGEAQTRRVLEKLREVVQEEPVAGPAALARLADESGVYHVKPANSVRKGKA